MTKRGRIVRDTSLGEGLLDVEGQQYIFRLERMWQSPVAPRVGMVVDVFIHPQFGPVAVKPAPETELVLEQADVVVQHASVVTARVKATVGVPTLVAAGTLAVGWFMLVSMRIGMIGFGVGLTFWQLMGQVGGTFLPLLAIISLGGPFLHHAWRDRRAVLGGTLPIGVMLATALLMWKAANDARQASSAIFGSFGADIASMTLSMMHYDIGLYISVAAAGFLAVDAVRRYLLSRV